MIDERNPIKGYRVKLPYSGTEQILKSKLGFGSPAAVCSCAAICVKNGVISQLQHPKDEDDADCSSLPFNSLMTLQPSTLRL